METTQYKRSQFTLLAFFAALAFLFVGAVTNSAVAQEVEVPISVRPSFDGPVIPIEQPTLSGRVFVDANQDGVNGIDELGIAQIQVAIFDLDTKRWVKQTRTNEMGYYSFWEIPNGNYQVVVVSALSEIESRSKYIKPITSIALDVSVGMESGEYVEEQELDFGFVPNIYLILDELYETLPYEGTNSLRGDGNTAEYWQFQFNMARQSERGDIGREPLTAYVNQIENLMLADPFQFAGSDKISEVFLTLSEAEESEDVSELLYRELLATELNHVAGRGLGQGFLPLQTIIIAWGEYLVAHAEEFSALELLEAHDIFRGINRTGLN